MACDITAEKIQVRLEKSDKDGIKMHSGPELLKCFEIDTVMSKPAQKPWPIIILEWTLKNPVFLFDILNCKANS